MSGAKIALVVPVLNEVHQLPSLTTHLKHWQARGLEVVVADGGSQDGTADRLNDAGFRVIQSPPGRAAQMNAAAQVSHAPILLFLHADTQLPDEADQAILTALSDNLLGWGRFDVRIDGRCLLLPLIARMMNLRSRLTGIATGDQAIFITRALFDQVGGFPDQPLMEDIELSVRLKKITAPICLKETLVTSGRRWDERGCLRTVLLMWSLRWDYWRGVSANKLETRYR